MNVNKVHLSAKVGQPKSYFNTSDNYSNLSKKPKRTEILVLNFY